jgi:hypothetical protein
MVAKQGFKPENMASRNGTPKTNSKISHQILYATPFRSKPVSGRGISSANQWVFDNCVSIGGAMITWLACYTESDPQLPSIVWRCIAWTAITAITGMQTG